MEEPKGNGSKKEEILQALAEGKEESEKDRQAIADAMSRLEDLKKAEPTKTELGEAINIKEIEQELSKDPSSYSSVDSANTTLGWLTDKLGQLQGDEHRDLREKIEDRISVLNDKISEGVSTTIDTSQVSQETAGEETPKEKNSTISEKKSKSKEKEAKPNKEEQALKDLDPKWTTEEEKAVQARLEEARQKYADAYKAFWKNRKEKAGRIGRAKIAIKGEKIKEEDVPKELKDLETAYDQMAIKYGQQMFDKKKAELAETKLSPKKQEEELKKYKQSDIFTRVVVQEQATLNRLKAENLPPKEKGIVGIGLDWYLKQPRWKKLLMSTTIATGIFASVFGTATVAGAVGVGAYAGKRLVRAVAGTAATQLASKAYDLLFKDKSTIERKKLEEELSKKFESEELDASLAKSKKQHAEIVERERKAKRNRLVTKALIGLAAGGAAAWGMGHIPQNIAGATEHIPTTGTPDSVKIANTAELLKKLNLNPDGSINAKSIELPDASDHSPQAEELRRIAASLGVHENIPITPQGPSLETNPIKISPLEVRGVTGSEVTPPASSFNAQNVKDLLDGKPGAGTNIANHLESSSTSAHEITSNFSIKLGENGVPKNLETAFNAIAANRMDVPVDGQIGEEFATKSLNMAANLVRLTEGKGVAGISAEDFGKAVSFKDGLLEVKDHTAFNQMLDKLQTHANGLWQEGTLQGKGAAMSNIGNISGGRWLEIMHAEGMDKGLDISGKEVGTGILGHDSITSEKIGNFAESELVKNAKYTPDEPVGSTLSDQETMESLRAKIEAHLSSKPLEVRGMTPDTEIKMPEELLPHTGVSGQAPENLPRGEVPGEVTPYNSPSPEEIARASAQNQQATYRPYQEPFRPIPVEMLSRQANQVYESNLGKMFSEDVMDQMQVVLKETSAQDLLETSADSAGSESMGNLSAYVHKLQELTGLEPKGKSLWVFGRNESTEDYIKRALVRMAQMGQLDKVKL